MTELQSEPLKVLDGFFSDFDNDIISGCEVAQNGDKFDVATGLVVLDGEDPDRNEIRVVAPFAGATSVDLPVYLTLKHKVNEAAYVSGLTKPVSYEYYAELLNTVPSTPFIKIAEDGGSRFVDMFNI